MRFTEPPSLDSPTRGRPGEDLDGLLRTFFRSEMPEPWPELRSPEEAPETLPLPERKRHSFPRSRFALAASIALLLTGGWLLSDSFKDEPRPTGATGKHPVADQDLGKPIPRVRGWHLEHRKDGSTELKMTLDQVPPKPKKDDAKDQLNDQLP